MEYDVAFDYLTVTFRCRREWEATIDKVLHSFNIGGRRRPWRFLRYTGYSVVSTNGHLAYGGAQAGGIIQTGGDIANQLVISARVWKPEGMRITRLDLAVTIDLSHPDQLVRQLIDHQRADWRAILPQEEKGGGTLYVGSRTSDNFGRLYDKGALLNRDLPADMQLPIAKLWRAELETKDKRARAAWLAAINLPTYDARREFIADTVLTWFQNRGVALPVHPKSRSIVSVASRGVDDVRTIKWFYEQVRPALLRVCENGHEQEALRALGIDPPDARFSIPNPIFGRATQFNLFDKNEDWC